MTLAEALVRTNAFMAGFHLLPGTGTLLAPDATLRVLGHDEPSPDARELFRRCGPIWLTFAAAHALAARRGGARTGGRSPGCAGPRSPPTSSGRARRPSAVLAHARACCWPVWPMRRWRSASGGWPVDDAHMHGVQPAATVAGPEEAGAACAIRLSGLRKTYGDVVAL